MWKNHKIQLKENELGTRIISKIASASIPIGLYDAVKEGDMWIIKVPEIAKKKWQT